MQGRENRDELNSAKGLLERLERIRAAGTVRMGADGGKGAAWVTANRKATPKVAWVLPPTDYTDTVAAGGSLELESVTWLQGHVTVDDDDDDEPLL